jgi:hypothetical protein
MFTYNIKQNASWTVISIDKIPVKKGKIEIGFIAEAEANAWCLVDDVELVRVK